VGAVSRATEAESDGYFETRPRGSQIGAWVSRQSAVIADRDTLERGYQEAEARFGDGPVPRPPRWGGYRLAPDEIELWQGRENRLHDRVRYRRDGDHWLIERLAP
jgi:pyridoxamine 5'-phosphate oxidase